MHLPSRVGEELGGQLPSGVLIIKASSSRESGAGLSELESSMSSPEPAMGPTAARMWCLPAVDSEEMLPGLGRAVQLGGMGDVSGECCARDPLRLDCRSD